jgi:hypothetical protein
MTYIRAGVDILMILKDKERVPLCSKNLLSELTMFRNSWFCSFFSVECKIAIILYCILNLIPFPSGQTREKERKRAERLL